MLNYFVRRLAAGVAAFLFASFVYYSLLVPPALALVLRPCDLCFPPNYSNYVHTVAHFKLDRPWPLNYLLWLYDPSQDGKRPYAIDTRATMWDWLPGADSYPSPGVLKGDFGTSMELQRDTPVLSLFGLDLTIFYSAWLAAILLGIAVAWLQRRGRSAPLRSHTSAAQTLSLNGHSHTLTLFT